MIMFPKFLQTSMAERRRMDKATMAAAIGTLVTNIAVVTSQVGDVKEQVREIKIDVRNIQQHLLTTKEKESWGNYSPPSRR